jgi:hypothetical protein
MARIANWRASEVMEQIGKAAEENANGVMDEVVEAAKARCPVGEIVRPGKWSGSRAVAFNPKTGKNRGQRVSFVAQKVWMGRQPGDLRDTIRRVNKPGSGNIRVYAGSFKIFWAHMVERGSVHWPAHPFLRPAFQAIKKNIVARIKNGKGD